MNIVFYNDSTGEELKMPVGASGVCVRLNVLYIGGTVMARYHADVQAWVVYLPVERSRPIFPCFRIVKE